MNGGVLLVDKPEGITSFGVVRRVRRLLGGARVGHVGSLDPFATGLLPVCVGRATRLVRFVTAGTKRYRAVIRFGQATDTDDRTGDPVGSPGPIPSESDVRAALGGFLGVVLQRPPPYSAKRVGGRRAYRLARSGKPPELAPVPVRIESLDLLALRGRDAEVRCETGPGTYIRALARDLGQRLGTAAHLAALRREAVAGFALSDASTLSQLEELGRAEVRRRILPPLAALSGMPRLPVDEEGARLLGHGRAAPGPAARGARREGLRAAVRPGPGRSAPELVAIVRPVAEGWRPVLVWRVGSASRCGSLPPHNDATPDPVIAAQHPSGLLRRSDPDTASERPPRPQAAISGPTASRDRTRRSRDDRKNSGSTRLRPAGDHRELPSA